MNDNRIFVVLIPSRVYSHLCALPRLCVPACKGWAHPVEAVGIGESRGLGGDTCPARTSVAMQKCCGKLGQGGRRWQRGCGRAGQGWRAGLPPPAPGDIPGEPLTSFGILIYGIVPRTTCGVCEETLHMYEQGCA